MGARRPVRRRVAPAIGNDLPLGAPNLALVRWAKAAGIPHRVTFHQLRKTFARITERATDYDTASRLLGHQSRSHVTSRYIREDFDLLRGKTEAVAAEILRVLGEAYHWPEPRTLRYRVEVLGDAEI